MSIDIYLTDIQTGERIRFPMLPEKINVQMGAVFQSYIILAVGDIKLPVGEELTGFSWDGILPGVVRRHEPYVTEWHSPHEIQGLWNEYKAEKKKLRLMVTETPIDYDVYIQRYNVEYSGGYGDFTYNISFIQAKDLKVAERQNTDSSLANKPQRERPSPQSKTHMVVKGDTIWRIAQKHYGKGSEYLKIYEANKDAIEADAKKHGKKSSEHGRWIWADTILILP